MSVDWAAIETAVKAWIDTTLTGAGIEAYWKHQPHPNAHGKWIMLSISEERAVGVDEVVWEENPPASGAMESVIKGLREFTVTVEARSRSQLPADAARGTLEKLRASLRLPTVTASLKAANVGFVRAEQFITIDTNVQGHRESIASMDVIFSTGAELRPAAPETWIEKAVVNTVEYPHS